ncbi:hypothetical protein CVT25_000687 [Psilocybe cyanescens]|uniref:Uncharacterized protein n=1 Tax=Psilocybe cyanescens TaxID=93625 RepID=A0A409XU54_PSICY|nr:hypothetical protein CVT25_000687 [Psilocybe cyanescens]
MYLQRFSQAHTDTEPKTFKKRFGDYASSTQGDSTTTTAGSSNNGHEPRSTSTSSPLRSLQGTQTPERSPRKRRKTSNVNDPKQRKLLDWGFIRQYLQAVPLIDVKHETRRISAQLVIENAKTNLYRERDAEFQAWKMHGGREGFLKYLYESYQIWDMKRLDGEKFPIPNSYEDAFKRVWDEIEPVATYQPDYYVVWTAVSPTSEPASGSSSRQPPSANNLTGPSQSPMKEMNASRSL